MPAEVGAVRGDGEAGGAPAAEAAAADGAEHPG